MHGILLYPNADNLPISSLVDLYLYLMLETSGIGKYVKITIASPFPILSKNLNRLHVIYDLYLRNCEACSIWDKYSEKLEIFVHRMIINHTLSDPRNKISGTLIHVQCIHNSCSHHSRQFRRKEQLAQNNVLCAVFLKPL